MSDEMTVNGLSVSRDCNTGALDQKRLDYYKSCIIQREERSKEASDARISYVATFGDINAEILAYKIECISKKKAIAYCQTVINSGGADISGDALQNYLNKCMNDYREQLMKMIEDNKKCSESLTVEFSVARQVRKIYRELARKIHPDINPDPYFRPYWHMLKEAYELFDLDRIKELKLLIDDALEKKGNTEGQSIDPLTPEELERNIKHVEDEIDTIIHTEPYSYRLVLHDEESVKEHREMLTKEKETYRKYSEELDKVLTNYKIIGGDTLKWIKI